MVRFIYLKKIIILVLIVLIKNVLLMKSGVKLKIILININ